MTREICGSSGWIGKEREKEATSHGARSGGRWLEGMNITAKRLPLN